MLAALADAALARAPPRAAPVHAPDDDEHDDAGDDAADAAGDDDEAIEDLVADGGAEPGDGAGDAWFGAAASAGPGDASLDDARAHARHDQSLILGEVDPAAWGVELERIVPKLRQRGAAHAARGGGAPDWSARLAQTGRHAATLRGLVGPDGGAMAQLAAVGGGARDARAALERGEKTLAATSSLAALAAEYKAAHGAHGALAAREAALERDVGALSAELADVDETVDGVKGAFSTRTASMTDTNPLVDIKRALKRLQGECAQLDVSIGLISVQLGRRYRPTERRRPADLDDDDEPLEDA